MLPLERASKIFNGFFKNGGTIQQRTIRGSVWLLASIWLTKPIQFIQTVILVRVLNPSDFGLMGILYVITGTMDVFTSTGIQSAIIQGKDIRKEALDTAWVFSIIRGITNCILLYILAPYVASFYETPIIEKIIKIFAITYLLGGFKNIGMVIFAREIDFKMIAIAEQIKGLLQMVVTVVFAIILKNVWALVIGYVVGEGIALIVSYLLHPFRPSFKFDLNIAKGLFSFGRYVFLSGIIIHIINKGDDALVGKVLSLETLGFYTLAYGLATLPSNYITDLISTITFSTFSRLQEEGATLRKGYLTTLELVSFISVPASAGIAILAPEIVEVVYGAKWLPMVQSLRVLCIFGMIKTIVSISGSLFQGVGKPNYLAYLSFAQLIIMIIIIYPLTITYNILGTSIAVVVPMVLIQGWALKKTSEIIKERLSVILKIISVPIAGSIVMLIVLSSFKNQFVNKISFLWLLGLVLLGGGVYCSAIFFVDRKIFIKMRTLISIHVK